MAAGGGADGGAGGLGDTDAAALMTDDLLQRLAAEQAPEAIKAYGTQSGAQDGDVLLLRVDFQKILRIDNLWSFTNLRKLQLDNNMIEQIENLDSLVHLEWLDLSFNHIERIEGLDKLTKLKDLTLHHNHITSLENMEQLTNLDCFSVGENELEALEETSLYLRQFKHLRMITLAGNPLCKDSQYEPFVISHLPTIVYLDYRRIAPETREAASVRYQDQLEVIQIKEHEAQQQSKKQQAAAKEVELYQNACVGGMLGPEFYDSMLDQEVEKLFPIPGVVELLEDFRTKFQEQVDSVATTGLKRFEERQVEQQDFHSAVKEGVLYNTTEGSKLVNAFLHRKMEVFAEIQHMSKPEAIDVLAALQRDLEILKDQLMSLEIDLVAQLEETLQLFERSYAELVQGFTSEVQEFFSEMRTHEETFHDQMTDLCVGFLDKFAKGESEGPVEVPDTLLQLLRDKATLTGAINGYHDNHLLAIDTKETAITEAATGDLEKLATQFQEKESKRNRARVSEICNLESFQRDEIVRMIESLS
eukprot:m.483927 g.483927  ORF g.483927 m.483927 type:complete len:531 (+) comp23120_c0_seq1:216-1808(+)